VGRDGSTHEVIWVKREEKYFCKGGWTGNLQNSPSGKSRDGLLDRANMSAFDPGCVKTLKSDLRAERLSRMS
jgi:hypothetical protein